MTIEDCALQNSCVSHFQHQPSGSLLSVEFKKQADVKEDTPLSLSKYQTVENTSEEKVLIVLVISRAKDDNRKEGPELAFSESVPPGFSNKVSDFKEEHSQLRSSWLVSWRKFVIHEGSC